MLIQMTISKVFQGNPEEDHMQQEMSNEKRAPGCLWYIGDYANYPVIWGLCNKHKDPY